MVESEFWEYLEHFLSNNWIITVGLGGPAVLQQHTEVQVQYICLPGLGAVSAGVGTVSLAPTHTIPVPNPNWLSALNNKKGQQAQSLDKEVKMRDMRTTMLTCYVLGRIGR